MSEASLAGTVLESRYRIERELGRGGMGRVFAAVDEQLGRGVAVKIIRDEVDDAEAQKRFVREARAAAALSHPHACQLYEVGEHEGQPFLVMELLEGETLANRIARHPLPEPEAVAVMNQLMDAVAAFHRAGLVHRDLKPSNVFLTTQGVKLLDFGLARPTQRPDSATATLLTSTNAVTGTMRHMAPEQVTGDPIDARTDIFALGVILFEMLTGRVPFDADSNIEWLNAVLKDDPPALSAPALAHLNPVITRALQRRPQDRYATVEEMAAALLAATAGDASKLESAERDERAEGADRASEAPSGRSSNGALATLILPFRLLQEDPELAPLRDGIPEALTVLLSSREPLHMISHRAAPDEAAASDIISLGKTLGADRVLAGTMLRGESELRITIQWIDAADGHVRWTQTFQYAIENLLTLQDRISEDIARDLPTT
jgi:serine/threonine protein kinase